MEPLPKKVVAWVAAGIATVSVIVVIMLMRWAGARGLDGEQLVTTQFDALRTGLSIGLGGGGLFALYLAWRRQRSTEIGLAQKEQDQAAVALAYALQERTALASEADAAARRITDLYTKAVEQIGSDKAPVRFGGLYALERLGQDMESQRETIVNVVCAYLRMPFKQTPPPSNENALEDERERHSERFYAHAEEHQVRLTALRILQRHRRLNGEGSPLFWSDVTVDLTGANLTGMDLTGVDLTNANLTGADLDGARLWGANLTGADLSRANLNGANLIRADLTGAVLSEADLPFTRADGAVFTRVDLTGANLVGACLINACLIGAGLTGANLAGAALTGANLTGANLMGAGLDKADLTQAQWAQLGVTPKA